MTKLKEYKAEVISFVQISRVRSVLRSAPVPRSDAQYRTSVSVKGLDTV